MQFNRRQQTNLVRRMLNINDDMRDDFIMYIDLKAELYRNFYDEMVWSQKKDFPMIYNLRVIEKLWQVMVIIEMMMDRDVTDSNNMSLMFGNTKSERLSPMYKSGLKMYINALIEKLNRLTRPHGMTRAEHISEEGMRLRTAYLMIQQMEWW